MTKDISAHHVELPILTRGDLFLVDRHQNAAYSVSMVYTLLQATDVCSPSPTQPLDFSPAFEILTFSSVTFPPDYLVTDASDFAFHVFSALVSDLA